MATASLQPTPADNANNQSLFFSSQQQQQQQQQTQQQQTLPAPPADPSAVKASTPSPLFQHADNNNSGLFKGEDSTTSSSLVRIFFKSPGLENCSSISPSEENFSLSLPLSTTIAQVKQRLSDVHPCKPSLEDQRIIFRGRILNDLSALSSLIQSTDENSVFHLVLKSGRYEQKIPNKEQIQMLKKNNVTQDSFLSTVNSKSVIQTSSTLNPPVNIHHTASPTSIDISSDNTITSSRSIPASLAVPVVVFDPHSRRLMAVPATQLVTVNGQTYYRPDSNTTTQMLAENNATQINDQAAAQPAPGPQPLQQQPNRFANYLWLIARLCVFVFLFTQDATMEKRIFIVCLASFIFLHETNMFSLTALQRRWFNRQAQGHQQLQQPQLMENQEAQETFGGNPPVNSSVEELPQTKGILFEVFEAVITFFASLVPSADQ